MNYCMSVAVAMFYTTQTSFQMSGLFSVPAQTAALEGREVTSILAKPRHVSLFFGFLSAADGFWRNSDGD